MLNYICLVYLSMVSAIPIIETMNNDHNDEYGCCLTCGYSWCPSTEICIRPWETYCKEMQFPYNALWKGSGIMISD